MDAVLNKEGMYSDSYRACEKMKRFLDTNSFPFISTDEISKLNASGPVNPPICWLQEFLISLSVLKSLVRGAD